MFSSSTMANSPPIPPAPACEPLKSRLPTARGKWRKMELVIPRAPIHLTGANMSGLQSKSERWVIGDEAWMWRKGMLGEMLKRLHRRWNGRAVLLGQPGFVEYAESEEVVGDDFTLLHYQGEQREWHFECPACKTRQAYSMDQVRIPEDGTHAERALAMTASGRVAIPVPDHRRLQEVSASHDSLISLLQSTTAALARNLRQEEQVTQRRRRSVASSGVRFFSSGVADALPAP